MQAKANAEKTWTLPEEFVDHRYLGPVHGNRMVAEYPIIRYPDMARFTRRR